jgi:hypothetical protein
MVTTGGQTTLNMITCDDDFVTSEAMLAVSLIQKMEPLGRVEAGMSNELPVEERASAGTVGEWPIESEAAATCSHEKTIASSRTAQLENLAEPRRITSW